ncbi:MAG: Omp28 family outer membrane lipoprotein [Lentimicrobiaceae bacterium]|nr:Omp28 family outer membrane lipoprotein [Lentimicrobiaceae bacterium]
MKIFKISNAALLISGFIIALVLAFAGCDKIDEPYTNTIKTADTTACPVPEFPDVLSVEKRVLLEDYTGQTCVNCPEAAAIAHNLKNIHGERLVVLSVHAGYFAEPYNSGLYTYDFRTEAGNIWNTFYGVIFNPIGIIDRKGYPGNQLVPMTGWSAKVATALSETPLVDLQLINTWDGESRKLCTHVKTRFITPVNKDLKLIVVLTESKIIKPQKNSNTELGPIPDIVDYEHNHVLRGAITLPWGTSVAKKDIPNTESVIKSFMTSLDEEFVPENCTVVAFIYDESNTEVLQTIEVPVITE